MVKKLVHRRCFGQTLYVFCTTFFKCKHLRVHVHVPEQCTLAKLMYYTMDSVESAIFTTYTYVMYTIER